jgi:6-phosphogluconolactonase
VANKDSNNVSGYAILSDGSLSQLTGSPYTAGASPSGIQVDPAGTFVYVTNLGGTASVSIFSIDTATPGRLNNAGSAQAGSQPSGIALK